MKTPKKIIPDVEIPSFYSPAWKEAWEKKPATDDQVQRLRSQLLSVIDSNRKDTERLNDFKKKALAAYSENEARVQIKELSEEVYARVAKRSSEMEEKLLGIKQDVRIAVDAKIDSAARNRHSDEIRSYLRSLKDLRGRMSFLREAINAEDLETIASVIDSPGYLSGLSKDDINHVRTEFIKKAFKNENDKIEELDSLQDHVGRGFKAFQGNLGDVMDKPEFEKAAAALKAAKSARQLDQTG